MGGRSEVEPPDSEYRFADQADRVLLARLQALQPMAEREDVMLAQALEITALQPCTVRGSDHLSQLGQLAVGKHVTLEELTLAPEPASRPDPEAGRARPVQIDDALIEECPAWSEHVEHHLEIALELGSAHVLDHSDARCLVVG